MEKWFYRENLVLPLEAESKEEAIEKLATVLLQNGYVKESFVPAIVAREGEFATGLPTGSIGVAIPHTDAIHVNKQAVGVAVLKNPVDFCIMGDPFDTTVPVRVLFMLAVPNKEKVMVMLQQVIAIIQDQDFLHKITFSEDREAVLALLDTKLNAGVVEAEAKAAAEEAGAKSVEVLITHPVGLHARPATVFVKAASKYKSKITVFNGAKSGNAKSILAVLSLAAVSGARIRIEADGEDALEALQGLKELVESDFGGVA